MCDRKYANALLGIQKFRNSSRSASNPPSTNNKCFERDNGECVLTKLGSPQVAHIFPYTMLNKPRNPSPTKPTPDFWGLLRIFWDADRIARWKSELFQDPQNPKTAV